MVMTCATCGFSVSPGIFLILKILWNYYQEFIKANGGQPIRLFHILKYERKLKIYGDLFFARL
jgi:hypothetical protein